ncbi:MAG: FAD-binding oxidoreductase [Salinarimonadaceae bacterium]|nr:MAG: FAD-binding oxidoreductase [Salinarimonadaceae bacterium]
MAVTAARAVSRNLGLERKLSRAIEGEARFDAFTRGRYATDASIYQIMPAGVVFPRTAADLEAILAIAREEGVAVVARGAGTSQNGQPLGAGLVVDFSRHLDRVLDYDPGKGEIRVEPGHVLESLNAHLKADGLFFPVEPSTASRCTIGGMAGNNASGARSLRYGKMADNVVAVEGLFHHGEAFRFGFMGGDDGGVTGSDAARLLASSLVGMAHVERAEIEARFPKVQRRVGGYNLDALLAPVPNLAHLLVGSEGTLALSRAITLKLAPLPAHRVIGVCGFPDLRAALAATQALVALAPDAVELVDRDVLALGAEIPAFAATLREIAGEGAQCLLVVEFSGDDHAALLRDLARLDACMADHGRPGAVVPVVEPAAQRRVWAMREACLNILMSAKGEGKPISFVEDCAVPLVHLAEYADRVTAIFEKHGTRGTWYAHASVGCLHVRPILDVKTDAGLRAMRAIAEEVFEEVRRFEGSHSGEHGDGISRSEFHEAMFGSRLVRAFEAVKDAFDPNGLLNPGKIVRAPRFDERALTRYPEGYAAREPAKSALDWSQWGGLLGAVEMCNNNGTCRKRAGGVMCPSFRVTQSETHVTRGRANALRLAMTGQLGQGALSSPAMKAAMELCVSCKACRSECPTGVDMARMKIEVLAHRNATQGLSVKDRLVAFMPRWAPIAARLRFFANLRDRVPGLAALSERILGLSARRPLPVWREPWREEGALASPDDVIGDGRDLVLFADTFNRYFEGENLAAATRVLRASGYRLHRVTAPSGRRPLCCGRTFLAAGLVDEARAEALRTREALMPFIERGARVVGLEPSCLLTMRDEFLAMLPGEETRRLAQSAFLFEEALEADLESGLVALPLADQGGRKALLHGHCHQKSFGALAPVERLLGRVPGLAVETIESGCCGMAGAFGYDSATYDMSMAMGEAGLLPAARAAQAGDILVADGTSCRTQVKDGSGREAIHVARLLDSALAGQASRR